MAGLHVSKLRLKDMRMVIFGSGTAGTGIADQVRDAIAADSNISKEEAAKQIWFVSIPEILINIVITFLTCF
jgi:malate dehydrogenase (oxaloacetate-decarboxylating)